MSSSSTVRAVVAAAVAAEAEPIARPLMQTSGADFDWRRSSRYHRSRGMRFPAPAVLCAALIATLACSDAGERVPYAAADGPTATAGARVLLLQEVLTIADSAVGLAEITAIAVGSSGTIVVVDQDAAEFAAFDSSGTLLARFGRRGAGPGEFERVGPVGWLNDTLVAVDARAPRATLIDAKAGRTLAVIPFGPVRGRVQHLHTAAGLLVAVSRIAEGPLELLSTLGAMGQRASLEYHPVTAHGFGAAISPFTTPSVLEALDQPVCATESGIHFDIGPFGDLGPLEGFTSRGELVTADRDSVFVTVKSRDPSVAVRSFGATRPPVPISDEAWDSVSAPYTELERSDPGIRCDPPYERPPAMPAARMMRVDEQDRIWIEVTEATGTSLHVFTREGELVGVAPMPERDQRVVWVVGRGRLVFRYGWGGIGSWALVEG